MHGFMRLGHCGEIAPFFFLYSDHVQVFGMASLRHQHFLERRRREGEQDISMRGRGQHNVILPSSIELCMHAWRSCVSAPCKYAFQLYRHRWRCFVSNQGAGTEPLASDHSIFLRKPKRKSIFYAAIDIYVPRHL